MWLPFPTEIRIAESNSKMDGTQRFRFYRTRQGVLINPGITQPRRYLT